MVRRGSSSLAAVLAPLLLLVAACSSGSDDADDPGIDPVEGAPVSVTVPEDADDDIGYLTLDGRPTLLYVRACQLTPTTDVSTGVTTELAIDLDDSISRSVSLTRSSTAGDAATSTDEVLIADDDAIVLESLRFETGGVFRDLRAPDVGRPMFEIEGDLVHVSGVFGPTGSVDGDPGLVAGALTVRCRPAG